MVKLILHNGREITNLRVNGTNFVSETKIDESIFPGNLETLTIEDTETGENTVLRNVEFIQQVRYKDGYYICFRELTQAELIQINNDLAITEIYEMILGGLE